MTFNFQSLCQRKRAALDREFINLIPEEKLGIPPIIECANRRDFNNLLKVFMTHYRRLIGLNDILPISFQLF